MAEMEKDLPDIPYVFISSVTGEWNHGIERYVVEGIERRVANGLFLFYIFFK